MEDFKIWDSHVHLFPPEIYENWDKYAAIDPWFGSLTERMDREGPEKAWANAEEALAYADKAGVHGLVMQGWYWNDPGIMELHNDYMAQCIREHPGRLKAFGSINPKFGERAIQEVERCAALGFDGIGELGPGGNGYDFEDPAFLEVLDCAEAHNLAVCIHCGEPVGHVYPGKDTTSLAPLPDVIRQHPGLKLILAHLGGGLPFYEMNPHYAGMFQNVRYDLAANPLLYRINSVRAVLDMIGTERLLFGSDFPLPLYPKKSRKRDMTMFVTDMRENAGLSQEEWEAVMSRNLLSFLTR